MGRYLKDEDLGWARVWLRSQHQASYVGFAIDDFCAAIRMLTFWDAKYRGPFGKASLWMDIARGLGCHAIGEIMEVPHD